MDTRADGPADLDQRGRTTLLFRKSRLVSPRKVDALFASTCPEVWGGSEELWSLSAQHLSEHVGIHVAKKEIPWDHPRIQTLQHSGVTVSDYRFFQPFELLARTIRRVAPAAIPTLTLDSLWLAFQVLIKRPKLCVVSQGDNFDGVHLANFLRQRGYPYILLSQKASDIHWPEARSLQLGRLAHHGALASCFVSDRNRQLTERQFGTKLENSRIVKNPCRLNRRGALPWPKSLNGRLKLACVARLWVPDKGQDILLEILSKKRWRNRKIEVSFIGSGGHRESLEACAVHLGLKNVQFLGQLEDMEEVWREHHALILPSRAEGTPLSAIEALSYGRPCVLSPVAGNAELLEENPGIGFLAPTLSIDGMNSALECLWANREHLEDMGLAAHKFAKSYLEPDPVAAFAELCRSFL